jgi:regulator of protease activity HflC (stomatin/prohibitin superfamily)
MFGFKVVNQYEQGIVFRFGKMLPDLRGPGLTWVNPISDRLRKVNMQIITAAVPGQEGITRDNVTVRVDAVVYYRVIDPIKAIINVQNYTFAVSQVAQTSLRSVIGHSDLDQLLSERDKVNAKLKEVIDAPTEGPWGIRVERVEVKDISLPDSMKRSMSRQAEAERERRARIISADGEYQASKKLAQAATVMSADPAALQLRLLQTVVEVAAEKNSTLVMPVPVELLRFFDRAARNVSPPAAEAEPPAAEAQADRSLPTAPAMPALTRPADLPANAALNAVPANAVPANAVPANAVPANAVPANAVPANAVPANAVPLNGEPKAPVSG